MALGLPSEKEALVLSLLADNGDLYGLQLVSLAKGKLKRGTVYVTLSRMEDKGWLRVVQDREAAEHAGMPRPRYRLSALGRRTLEAFEMVRAALGVAGGRA